MKRICSWAQHKRRFLTGAARRAHKVDWHKGAVVSAEILVINAGSSSIKVSLFAPAPDGPLLRLAGEIEGIGVHPRATAHDDAGKILLDQRWPASDGPRDHDQAMAFVVEHLTAGRPGWEPAAVGHRVVHGGTRHREPVVVDPAARAYLQTLVPLAPLHEPANLAGIDAAGKAFPGIRQVACFDTAFHQGHPWVADTFALPREFYEKGLRRYGFHGLSYAYIVRAMRRLAPQAAGGRMIVAHLGNGASMCAVRGGQSIESTMSFTALDGLPMGTRCGQIDPGVLLYLLGQAGLSVGEVNDLLYKKSGLLGLSGVSPDMRDLLASEQPAAREAVDYFVHRIVVTTGALTAALGGLEALVFTAGIGEHAAPIRARVCERLGWLGLTLDEAANARHGPRISTPASPVSAWVVPTDEERMIAIHVMETLGL
jgi:acetate kinase